MALFEPQQVRTFGLSICIRDHNGNTKRREFFQTDSADELYDWYWKNNTNPLDTAMVRRKRKKKPAMQKTNK